VYNHQNWYKKKVETVLVSGFNNVDWKYKISMNKIWSFCDFMREQPTHSMTVPIDIEMEVSRSKEPRFWYYQITRKMLNKLTRNSARWWYRPKMMTLTLN
jgi:hypothetical protein